MVLSLIVDSTQGYFTDKQKSKSCTRNFACEENARFLCLAVYSTCVRTQTSGRPRQMLLTMYSLCGLLSDLTQISGRASLPSVGGLDIGSMRSNVKLWAARGESNSDPFSRLGSQVDVVHLWDIGADRKYSYSRCFFSPL